MVKKAQNPQVSVPEKQYKVAPRSHVKITPTIETNGVFFNYLKLSISIADTSIAKPVDALIASKTFIVEGVAPGKTKAVIKLVHSEAGNPLKETQSHKFNIVVLKEEK